MDWDASSQKENTGEVAMESTILPQNSYSDIGDLLLNSLLS